MYNIAMTANDARGGPDTCATQPQLQVAFEETNSALISSGHLALDLDCFTKEALPYSRDVVYEAGMNCVGRHVTAVSEGAAAALAIGPEDVISVVADGTLMGPDTVGIVVQRADMVNPDGLAEVSQTVYSITRRISDGQDSKAPSGQFTSGIEGRGNLHHLNGEIAEAWEYDQELVLSSRQAAAMMKIAQSLPELWRRVVASGLHYKLDPTIAIPNN